MSKRIYPEVGRRLLFDGGKNSKFERSIIEDNESPDCLNVVFTNGAVETRQGYSKLNSNAIGSYPIDGIYTRHDQDGSESMVVFCGGDAYTWDAAASTFATVASAQSVFTQGIRVSSEQQENHIFFGNGQILPYKYNGTDFTRHGIYPPTTTMTAATAPTGTGLSGTFSYRVTFINSNLVESDVGPAVTHTVASEDIRLTSIPTAAQSWGVSSRRIYRTEVGGTTYKRLTTINDNSTTTFDDSTADASLGADAPTDQGVPPNYDTIVYHQNRLFMNDPDSPNFIKYTEIANPYVVKAENFIRVGDNSTDLVKGLAVYGDSVVAFCERSIWLIYMPDATPANWLPIKVRGPFGSGSKYSYIHFDNRLLFGATQNDKFVGFGALEGAAIEPSATFLTTGNMGSLLKTDRIEPDMFAVQDAYLANISSIIYKNKAWITLTYSGTTNNRVYQMDFSLSNLSKNQDVAWVPFTGINAAQFTILDGNLYFGTSESTGRVYQLEDGTYNDDGSAINSYIWTKEFSGFKGEYPFHKDFRFANLLIEKVGGFFMDFTYRVNSDTGDGDTVQVDLDQGGNQWGSLVWGEDEWGGGVSQEDIRLFLGTASGERIQFKFSNQNTADQRFKVHGLNFAYNKKGYR